MGRLETTRIERPTEINHRGLSEINQSGDLQKSAIVGTYRDQPGGDLQKSTRGDLQKSTKVRTCRNQSEWGPTEVKQSGDLQKSEGWGIIEINQGGT